MKALGAWTSLGLALVLLGASAVSGRAVRGQLTRDSECTANVREHVRGIEAFRTKHGRLPRREELRGGGMAVIDYRVVSGLVGKQPGVTEYELTLWRGEWSVRYASSTGQNTCDSGATQAALWLAALLFLPGVALLVWSVCTLRAA